jgi:hypothetical protein
MKKKIKNNKKWIFYIKTIEIKNEQVKVFNNGGDFNITKGVLL